MNTEKLQELAEQHACKYAEKGSFAHQRIIDAFIEGFDTCENYDPKSDPDYEPYFGWCDVEGCKNEGCSGGNAWRDTGYWTVCYKHSDMYRKGHKQPQMKQSAIDRESSRDKVSGYLP